MKIALGSDHAGWELKNHIIKYLKKKRIKLKDFGVFLQEPVDYPDIAYPVAKAIARKKFDRGILFCGSGVGMAMTANKIKGVRAAQCYDLYTARMSREHNDANVLSLAGRILDKKLAVKIVDLWLRTKFLGGRHLRRVKKIEKLK